MTEPSMDSPVALKRWHTENLMFALVLTISIIIWTLMVVTIVGAVYAVFIGLFLFVSHLSFIAYIRGSATKISSQQFPQLYDRIQQLGRQAGFDKVPDTYILQAGGDLNAFATKFAKSHLIVLFADLLEACEDDPNVRDMIIGHELAHVKAGHLKGMWFLFPGLFFPLIGHAYSRAREYTCDRFGAALCGDSEAAVRGMTLLSVGGKYYKDVDVQELVGQHEDLNTGLMQFGLWLNGYPPLCSRITALSDSLKESMPSVRSGVTKGIIIVVLFSLLMLGPVVWIGALIAHEAKNAYKENVIQVEQEGYNYDYAEEDVIISEDEKFIQKLRQAAP